MCGVQMDPALGDVEANLSSVCGAVAAAADEGARLVVFPEAALTGYMFESSEEALEAAVDLSDGTLDVLYRTCRRADVWAVCGTVERAGRKLYNTVLMVGPGGLIGRYRKTHLLCLGVDRFTRPGREPYRVFNLPLGRVGLNICYDGSFPEPGRILKLMGAQLILLPTNWPVLSLKLEQVQVRACENHVNYFAVNRVGVERGTRFEGGSCAAGPRGEILAQGGAGVERIHVDFDLASADQNHVVVRAGEYEFDYVSDRRPDLYGPLAQSSDTFTIRPPLPASQTALGEAAPTAQ